MDFLEEAYEKSLGLMRSCLTPQGFLAATTDLSNYKRVWGRDSMICSLASMMSGEKDLFLGARKSLEMLAKYQHKEGQVPSNVDIKGRRISYGGTAGRVDATLWFVVCFGQYIKRSGDKAFLKKRFGNVEKAMQVLRHYEYNNKNLVYVPQSGDWADEYLQRGYVLYDEILYYLATKEYNYLLRKTGKKEDKAKQDAIRKVIQKNFAITKENKKSKYIYDPVTYENALKKPLPYFASHFTPSRYSTKFDGLSNSMALLSGIFEKKYEEQAREHMLKNFGKKTHYLIPAFLPVIRPGDAEWRELKTNYKYQFHNKPHQYSNGGLWPMITGFFSASLQKNDAKKYAEGIAEANSKDNWSFFEYINGKTFKGNGNTQQCWSAAAQIIANKTIEGKKVFL